MVKLYKMLSYRRQTVLQGGLVMAQNGRLELGENIYGHYWSIFNHCDVGLIGRESNQIQWMWLKIGDGHISNPLSSIRKETWLLCPTCVLLMTSLDVLGQAPRMRTHHQCSSTLSVPGWFSSPKQKENQRPTHWSDRSSRPQSAGSDWPLLGLCICPSFWKLPTQLLN